MDSVTFETEDSKPIVAVLDPKKYQLGKLTAESIFAKLAKQFMDSEYPELYFYTLIAIHDQCKEIISGIGAEKMKQGIEL